MPGQTLADVEDAEVKFVEEVLARHPNLDKPAIMGNCQAGWAAALLCADRPDLVGPLVLNGAPLSYWAGVEGANPMRYKGGLGGGVWMNTFLSDLGNGKFDGPTWFPISSPSIRRTPSGASSTLSTPRLTRKRSATSSSSAGGADFS